LIGEESTAVEAIVIDDGSTDNSLDVIKSFGDRIRWQTGPNRGACAARNSGLELARAPFVQFLDADDHLEGPFLASGLAAMRTTDAHMGFGPLKVAWPERSVTRTPPPLSTPLDALRLVYSSYSVQPATVILRTDFARTVGGWHETLHRFQDKEFIARCLAHNPRVCRWEEGFGVFVQHPSSARISARSDDAAFGSQMQALRRCAEHIRRIEGVGEPEFDQLRRNGYQLLRAACRSREPQRIRLAGELYRELGGAGHYGNFWHRCAATFLGLHRKEAVAAMLARRRTARRPA